MYYTVLHAFFLHLGKLLSLIALCSDIADKACKTAISWLPCQWCCTLSVGIVTEIYLGSTLAMVTRTKNHSREQGTDPKRDLALHRREYPSSWKAN